MRDFAGWKNINGTDAWICENQWATDWGVERFIYIATDPTENDGAVACGIYTQKTVALA